MVLSCGVLLSGAGCRDMVLSCGVLLSGAGCRDMVLPCGVLLPEAVVWRYGDVLWCAAAWGWV